MEHLKNKLYDVRKRGDEKMGNNFAILNVIYRDETILKSSLSSYWPLVGV